MKTAHSFAGAARLLCLLLVAFSLPMAGCACLRQLTGTNTVDLTKAEVKKMGVDIRKAQKTICPREDVQMAIFAEAVLEGDKEVKKFETWQGRGHVNKNDKIDFTEFAFQSDQGSFNDQGWFAPKANLLATVGKEYEIKSVYKRRPDKFSFTTTYKPDYLCIKGAGKEGPHGQEGHGGQGGQQGPSGSFGSSTSAGGNGRDGGSGGPGGNGTDGGSGPRVQLYVTMVKTAFYEKLVGARVTGDIDDFVLFPAEQAFALHANGGTGGPGGPGGHGGQGGSGGSGNPGGNGGNGGPGGNGGNGGNGGAGGTIDFVYDARFPELASIVHSDAAGGPAGEPGPAGSGGSGGGQGSGNGQGAQMGAVGQRGADGSGGAPGQKGADGRTTVHAGNVSSHFADLPGVTVL
jgi:hypothetical protein